MFRTEPLNLDFFEAHSKFREQGKVLKMNVTNTNYTFFTDDKHKREMEASKQRFQQELTVWKNLPD